MIARLIIRTSAYLFKLNGFSHSYQFGQSISVVKIIIFIKLLENSVEPADLVLYCLLMTHKENGRLISVNGIMPLHNAIIMDKIPTWIIPGHGSIDKYQVNDISLLCIISTYVVSLMG